MRSRFGALVAVVAVAVTAGSLIIWKTRPRADILRGQQMVVQEEVRDYRLVIPHSLDPNRPAPIVFAFHGAGDTPEQMAHYTGLDQLAGSEGFYLVYPQGRFLSWPPSILADNPEPVERELMFFDALLGNLMGRYQIDQTRVYAVGMSQGGAFVNLLATKRNARLAAAASHSGWLPPPLPEEGWKVDHACPVLFIVGAKDSQVTPASVRTAHDCFERQGHPTELLVIPELGHCWAREHGINATIWRFLCSHRL